MPTNCQAQPDLPRLPPTLTMNQQPLSNSVLQRYRQDGFYAFDAFLEPEQSQELLADVNRFIQESVPHLPREHVFYEERNDLTSLKQIQHLEEHDDRFGHLLISGRFRTLAESLLDGEVVPKNMQYFNKPAGMGKPTPPHQDGHYFKLAPCEALTMWLALDEVDEENGCVRYIPGSNHAGMRAHARTTTLGFSQGIVDFPTADDRSSEVALPASPGDLLVHDALTIHRADGNRSANRPRRALGLIYYSVRAKEDTAAQLAYQQALADELKAAGKI